MENIDPQKFAKDVMDAAYKIELAIPKRF